MDHGLKIIAGHGLERYLPKEVILLFPQTADGKLIDPGHDLLDSTAELLADRASQGGLAIGHWESKLLVSGRYDPLHDEWNQA